MHRLRPAAVLVLAVLLAAQLTLHNHSLVPEGGAPALTCAVCAFGADGSSLDTLLPASALVALGLVATLVEAPVLAMRRLVRTGRAPPVR